MELWVGKPFLLEGNVSDGSSPEDIVAWYSSFGLSLYRCDPNGLESLQISVRKFHTV